MAVKRNFSRRAPQRKFVWARSAGKTILPAGPNRNQVDLLADFQTEYGAQLLGATVMRVRGVISVTADAGVTAATVVGGIRVFTEGVTPGGIVEAPLVDQHADWMAIFPAVLRSAAVGSTFGGRQFEVDVKSARKLEELGQGLAMSWSQDEAATKNLIWHLSIGLKLA